MKWYSTIAAVIILSIAMVYGLHRLGEYMTQKNYYCTNNPNDCKPFKLAVVARTTSQARCELKEQSGFNCHTIGYGVHNVDIYAPVIFKPRYWALRLKGIKPKIIYTDGAN